MIGIHVKMLCKILEIAVLICCMSGTVFSKPFLYNSITSLASSASASASSSQPYTNIADLRAQKAAKLENEKLPQNEDDNNQSTFSIDFPEDNNNNNEAAPSLIQKKVNKIFAKLRFLSQLSGASASQDKDDEFQKEQDDFDKEFEDEPIDVIGLNSTTVDEIKSNKQKVLQGYYYNEPPQKLQVNIEESDDGDKAVANKGDVSPSNIAVFFTELIASVAALIYGAAAQINASTNTAEMNQSL